jgi:cation:H+ antiporter
MIFVYLIVFIISFFVLAFSSKRLVSSLTKLAKFLGWKEFVVAFFTMAMAGAIPNLSIGLSSALHKIPELSFSEIIGGNIIDLTIAMALATLISKRGLRLASKTVQGTAIFTLLIALLPIFLILDKELSRIDGVLLISAFIIYSVWLFGRKDRFSKVYNKAEPMGFRGVFSSLFSVLGSVILLLLAAEGIVRSATFFSQALNLPIVLIGILIVGLGNALPEIFFSIQAAKRGHSWMVAGNLMGSVIFPVTLVLGIVALICPIKITDFSPFVIGRFFLIISAIFFLIFIWTGKRIVKKEAVFLLLIYLFFVLAEIFH